MFTAMKEDYSVEAAGFLSAVHKEESGRIFLEALKSGVPLTELQKIYRKEMLPIELREKILPLMQGREAIPEKIGERMEFITEAVRDLKESFLRQNSFIEDLKKSMEERQDILSAQEKDTGAATEIMDDPSLLSGTGRVVPAGKGGCGASSGRAGRNQQKNEGIRSRK